MILGFLVLGGLLAQLRPDPSEGALVSRERARELDCVVTDPNQAAREHPGRVRPDSPRGAVIPRTVILCERRMMRRGLRPSGTEAVLDGLRERAAALAVDAAAVDPDLRERTWLVESDHPDAQVVNKLSFAAKNALAERGLTVSDRSVTLGAGDVDVLGRMEPLKAWPAACSRYAQGGSLGAGDALLVLTPIDSRDTTVHAGVCADGRWSWLQ